MSNFCYINNKLFVERTSVGSVVKKNKTPFYLYSEKQLKENYLNFLKSFKKVDPLICFSLKSNSNLNILKMLGKLGVGADVVSGGELLKAIKAGIKPSKIVFSGVGKTEEELKLVSDFNFAGLGIDHNMNISEFLSNNHKGFIQGNFDESKMLMNETDLSVEINSYCDEIEKIGSIKGWVCGLGHGINKATPEKNVHLFIDIIRKRFK